MTQRQYLTYMLILLSITLSFFFGYFIFRYQQIQEDQPQIKMVDEINPKVCTVDIDSIKNGLLHGRIGESKVRIRYDGEVQSPDLNGDFEFEFNY